MRQILLDAVAQELDLARLQQLAQHDGAVGLERIDVRLS